MRVGRPLLAGYISSTRHLCCLARVASRANSLQGNDASCMNNLARTVRVWQKFAALKCASSSHPGARAREDTDGRRRVGREKIHCGTMSLAGWSDAVRGDQSAEGRCRLGYVIGLMSSALYGPCHIFRRNSKFTKEWTKSSLGEEVFAFR